MDAFDPEYGFGVLHERHAAIGIAASLFILPLSSLKSMARQGEGGGRGGERGRSMPERVGRERARRWAGGPPTLSPPHTREQASLGWTSFISIFAVALMVGFVASHAPAAAADTSLYPSVNQTLRGGLEFINVGSAFSGIGTMMFAFVCHHRSSPVLYRARTELRRRCGGEQACGMATRARATTRRAALS